MDVELLTRAISRMILFGIGCWVGSRWIKFHKKEKEE